MEGKPGLRVGEYVLEKPIGHGTFAEVWLARHNTWPDVAAVKLPTESEYVRYLRKEGEILRRLRHANIISVLGIDPFGEPPYLIMELVEGPTLRQVLEDNRGGLPVETAGVILRGILNALAAAHAAGVVHRDLKPANVILHLRDLPLSGLDAAAVKVGDFGLSTAQFEMTQSIAQSISLARKAPLVGTLAYMAPEVRDGGTADQRSDLYSLGVILFELLTGQRPSGADLPSEHREGLPAWADGLFKKLCARHSVRYESATHVLTDLERAGPVAPPKKGKAPVRNRKAPAEPRTGKPSLPVAPPTPDVITARTVTHKAAEAPAREPESEIVLDLGDHVRMALVLIPPGEFVMGSPDSEAGRHANEGPRHRVTISRSSYMGVTQVTQAQWQAVMGRNPSYFKGDGALPVESVSWDDCQEFCRKLSEKVGRMVRLPTEAEWEYACRAGSATRFCFGDSDGPLAEYGWYRRNSGGRTHPVRGKKPNAWGLYDMHGNVSEWCSDWYAAGYYQWSPGRDPGGLADAWYRTVFGWRVLRGGDWDSRPSSCRSARRDLNTPGGWRYSIGFRCSAEMCTGYSLPVQSAAQVLAGLDGAGTVAGAREGEAPAEPRTGKPSLPVAPSAPDVITARKVTHKAADAPARKPLPSIVLDLGGNVTMRLVLIPPGEFMMGSDESVDEKPMHRVTISRPFYMGTTPVTRAQWRAVLGKTKPWFGRNRPIADVAWADCQTFCRRLSEKTGRTIRLPTEAEWEYACRAGSTGRYCFGDSNGDLGEYAWFYGNGRGPFPVGLKKPNAWGLYDMHGNVWEWCADWYGPYTADAQVDPAGPSTGTRRVLRGGSWDYFWFGCCSARRANVALGIANHSGAGGFRCSAGT